MMKCPFRKTVIHKPEYSANYTKHFAEDKVIFEDCYETECPFYFYVNETSGSCKRTERCTEVNDEATDCD